MKKLLALAVVVLAGCNATAPRQAAVSPLNDPSRACFAAMGGDQRFTLLRDKIAIDRPVGQLPIEMLADKGAPTAEEKRALGIWQVARESCIDQGATFRATSAPPGYASLYDAGQVRLRSLIAKLYSGDMSYGDFNQARAALSVEQSRDLAAWAERGQAAEAQAAAIREANRQQAAQNFQNSLYQQQLLMQQRQQMNRPIQTNCYRNGQYTNCTTY